MLPAVLLLSIVLLTGGTQNFDDDGPTMRIPMRRSKNQNSVNHFLRKFNSPLEDSNEIHVILDNVWNEVYRGEITMGTPPQKFVVVFDTGYRHTWIASEQCDSTCDPVRKYNSSASSTYKANGTKVYLWAEQMHGFLSEDTVCVGRQCAAGQYFLEITNKPEDEQGIVDGAIGLAPAEKSPLGVTSFFHSLLEQKKISNPVFAFWFNRKLNESGELILGGIDKRRYEEPITWVNLTQPNRWEINMDHAELNSVAFGCEAHCAAEIHTDTPWFAGPPAATDAIHKSLGFEIIDMVLGKMYTKDNCTEQMIATYPDLILVIAGKKYAISAKEYMHFSPGEDDAAVGACMSWVLGMNGSKNQWILGLQFPARYYTIFDVGQLRIGLADLKKEKKKEHFRKSKFMKKLWHRMRKFV